MPSEFMLRALQDMTDIFSRQCRLNRLIIGEKEGKASNLTDEVANSIKVFGTPRRMVLYARLPIQQEDENNLVIGPAAKVAFDEQGKPTKAGMGFARSRGVKPEDLKIIEGKKGEHVAAQVFKPGRKTVDILPDILSLILRKLHFRKRMRWADFSEDFARPVHWLLALFGSQVIKMKFNGVESANRSRGHYFMAPEEFPVTGLTDYLDSCQKRFVAVDHRLRGEKIRDMAAKLASQNNGAQVAIDHEDTLWQTINFLLEYPHPLQGEFDQQYLKLPREVLISVMKTHQKYIPVKDGADNLINRFIFFSNNIPRDDQVVINGNQRVIRARLEDAVFYYHQDLKLPLSQLVEGLKGVVFHRQLGTSYAKMERFKSLAQILCAKLFSGQHQLAGEVENTALLCKADLLSGMVGEFPELQGIMGREYHLHQGGEEAVAKGIFEHYLPRFAGDDLAENHPGALVGIADRLDTITAIIGIGKSPTGQADPFALRRQCLAVIRTMRHHQYHLSLGQMILWAVERLQKEIKPKLTQEKWIEAVHGFFQTRFIGDMQNMGYPTDIIKAVMKALNRPGHIESRDDDLIHLFKKIEILDNYRRKCPDFADLAVAFKRVMNIIKGEKPGLFLRERLQEKEEKELADRFLEARQVVRSWLDQEMFKEALEVIVTLKPAVDDFFDHVMVMDENIELKNNRLALLQSIGELFMQIADFSVLQISTPS